ncbi:hypothetical protein, partial [Bombilactobacillus bombi]|uniref:hypothetical protein n=1 Tax=Bombilactobacillus bombi TaxID=1303590 RepID=UPI00359C7E29|nr:hypothetical protein [Bombilactobacillus bombi]
DQYNNYPTNLSNSIGYIQNEKFNLKNSVEQIYLYFMMSLFNKSLLKLAFKDYQEHQYLENKVILLKLGNKEYSGTFIGISDNGELNLKSNLGVRQFNAGEVLKVIKC